MRRPSLRSLAPEPAALSCSPQLTPWRCGRADYTKGEALPTEGLDSLAPCVSAVVMKDCVLNPDSPQVRVKPTPSMRCSWIYEDSCCLEWQKRAVHPDAWSSLTPKPDMTTASRSAPLTPKIFVVGRQEEEYEVDEGEPLPKVDVLVLPGSGSVDFDPLLSALQSPVRFLRVFPASFRRLA